MGDIVRIHCETTLDVPVENVISGAIDAKLKKIIIIGENEDEREFYFASSSGYAPDILWELERAKHTLLDRAI